MDLFEKIKDDILSLDPVYWCEKYLTLDGEPFRLTNNGYKPFADIYRYIGAKSLERNSKPVVVVAGRQVGKSTLAAALSLYFTASNLFGNNKNPPMRVLHVFPQESHVSEYAKTKLSPLISTALIGSGGPNSKGKIKSYIQEQIDNSSPSNDGLTFKQFKNGSYLRIDYTGLYADRIRGRTIDAIFFDEIQDMLGQAIANTLKVLTQAQYGAMNEGVRVFFGTPKLKGSEFWRMWNKSNQQYFHLGCSNCDQHFPLYTPNSNDWEKIWIRDKIVRCPHCGFEQDKVKAAERGKWIATRPDDECDFIGFHISQMYIPNFTKEKIIREKPENSAINTEKTFQNEVLGEFYQGEASILTPDQVIDICGDRERKFRAYIEPKSEPVVFMGIDIGDKNDIEQLADKGKSKGQSYSTAVILVPKGTTLSVEFVTKFKKNDTESKKAIIRELMKRYSVDVAVCDIGYAHELCEHMQTEYGDKFLTSRAGEVRDKVKFDQEIFPKEIKFSRDFYIEELYNQMKKGIIRIPLGNSDHILWAINQFCNLEIKPSISRTGLVTPRYVKSGANDAFMALLNAYLAYRFWLTKGFKEKNPLLFKDKKEKDNLFYSVYLPSKRL